MEGRRSGGKLMPNIGDRIKVQIRGDSRVGTAITSGSTGLSIRPGGIFEVPGRIIEDRGTSWLVELDSSLDGRNRVLLPKSAHREQLGR